MNKHTWRQSHRSSAQVAWLVTELITLAEDGSPANESSGSHSVSSDGRWVVFMSIASNLSPEIPMIYPTSLSTTVKQAAQLW